MSYATPEGRVVKKLLDYLHTIPRCVAHKVHGGQFSAGEPDLDIVIDGHAVKVEVKLPGTEHSIRKALTPLQRASLHRYQRAGACVGVVTSVEELQSLLWGWGWGEVLFDDIGDPVVLKRVLARLD